MNVRQAGAVVYRNARGPSAIDEYSRHLVAALRAAGAPARYVDDGLSSLVHDAARPDWILLQYNPFSYGRWGVGPELVRDAVRARRRWPRTPLVLTVHEAWVAMRDWRSALMGCYQRAQLRLLLQLADRVIVVRESLARELGRACVHVPVASNITPTEATPAEARLRLGIGGELVVGLFGTGRPERRMDHAEAAIAALAAQRGVDGLCVLNLGRDSLVPAVPNGVEIRTPGVLASDEVSLHLRATDLLLLPIADGLCTRRTTLMAGLAHGLPVLGLRGPTTDGVLVEHPDCVVLTPCGDLDTYARAAVQLAGDPARLRATGVAGRDLYRDRFDWPHTARMVLATLDLARSRS